MLAMKTIDWPIGAPPSCGERSELFGDCVRFCGAQVGPFPQGSGSRAESSGRFPPCLEEDAVGGLLGQPPGSMKQREPAVGVLRRRCDDPVALVVDKRIGADNQPPMRCPVRLANTSSSSASLPARSTTSCTPMARAASSACFD